jgi:hypothetical protein
MKKQIWLVLLSLLTGTNSALARDAEIYSFYCGLLQASPAQQVSIRMTAEDLASGNAEVSIANFVDGKGWVVFESATNAQVVLEWSEYTHPEGRGTIDTIVAAEISLGRTGSISMKTTAGYDENLSAPGSIVSNLRGFNYPNGIDGATCTYFGGKPKPGVTGSN